MEFTMTCSMAAVSGGVSLLSAVLPLMARMMAMLDIYRFEKVSPD
jgi:hypothetical protein